MVQGPEPGGIICLNMLERRKVDLIQHRAIIQRKGKGIGFICLLSFRLQLRNA